MGNLASLSFSAYHSPIVSSSATHDPERRRYPRVKAQIPVELTCIGAAPMRTSTDEISLCGCYIETMFTMEVETERTHCGTDQMRWGATPSSDVQKTVLAVLRVKSRRAGQAPPAPRSNTRQSLRMASMHDARF